MIAALGIGYMFGIINLISKLACFSRDPLIRRWTLGAWEPGFREWEPGIADALLPPVLNDRVDVYSPFPADYLFFGEYPSRSWD